MTRAATMGQKVSSSALLVSEGKARPLLLPLDPTIRVLFATDVVALVAAVVVVVAFCSGTVTSAAEGVALELGTVLSDCAKVVPPLVTVASVTDF